MMNKFAFSLSDQQIAEFTERVNALNEALVNFAIAAQPVLVAYCEGVNRTAANLEQAAEYEYRHKPERLRLMYPNVYAYLKARDHEEKEEKA